MAESEMDLTNWMFTTRVVVNGRTSMVSESDDMEDVLNFIICRAKDGTLDKNEVCLTVTEALKSNPIIIIQHGVVTKTNL